MIAMVPFGWMLGGAPAVGVHSCLNSLDGLNGNVEVMLGAKRLIVAPLSSINCTSSPTTCLDNHLQDCRDFVARNWSSSST